MIQIQEIMRPKGSALERGLMDFVRTLRRDSLIAEVGSFAGESTVLFLEKAWRIYCIDPWSDYSEEASPGQFLNMVGMGLIEQQFDARLRGQIQHGKVVKLKMTSVKASEKFGKIFDVVYLDGNHSLESVLEDISAWIPKVKVGGIISGHDYDRGPVKQAVFRLLGGPDKTFEDNTWMKRL